MKAKNLISVLLVLLFLPLVSAGLIPTDAPCWYKGTVTSSDLTVEGLTVEAYKGSTLLISGNIASGAYELNSVGANDGDIIQLKVYGATFANSTFVGFCKTGSDPWVVEDFTVSLQANGASCSNNAICTSGLCSSNVCTTASSGGGGGKDTPKNTSTTTTGSTTGSTGTGSGSGSGSTSTTLIEITVPGIDTLEERNEIVSEVTKALEINTIEIESIKQETESQTTTEFTLNKEDTTTDIKTDFNQVVQNAVNAELEKYSSVQVSVSTKSKVIKVTKKDGTEQKVTKIEKEITISSTDIKGNTIRVIQVIPKEVASSASKISGNFVVLEDDPVLAFDIPTSSIVNGKVNLDYTVAGDVLQSSLDKIVTSVVDKTTIATNNVIPVNVVAPIISDTPLVADNTTQTASSNNLTRILIVVVLVIVIAIALVIVNSRKKTKAVAKNDSDDFITITYSYSSTDPDYRKIKDYIERYKHEYSKELLVEALRKAKFKETLIKKVLHEEYTLNKDTEYYMPNSYTYTSNDPNYKIIKDYIEKYKYEYSKKDLVNALKKQNFSEEQIKKVLHEEYK